MKPARPAGHPTLTAPAARPSVFAVSPAVSTESYSALSAAKAQPAAAPGYRWLLLLVIGLAVLGFGSLMTLVTAALTPISEELNTSLATAGWVMTGLMLAMAVSTPMGGKLADSFGHRRVFMVGMVGMTAAMIVNTWVPNIGSFIAVRVVFGMCGGMLMPSGMALLMHAFGPADRARAVGWFQFAMTGAPTIGVIAGGPLLNVFGWRGIFMLFGIVGLVGTALAALVVKPIPHGERVPIDFLGALLLAAGTLLVLLAITRVPTLTNVGVSPLRDGAFLAMLGGAVLCYLAFPRWERRVKAPLLDLRLFRRASFTLPLIAAPSNQFAYMGAFTLVPAILQTRYGYSVGAAALLMVPRPGAFAIASPLGGTIVSRFGARAPMLFGTIAMIGSMLAFAVGVDPAGWGLFAIFVGLVLSGLSAGIGSPAYQMLVANSVEDKDLGVANGMNQTVMWIGIIFGIQTMLAFAGDDPSLGRLRATFVLGAFVAAIGFIAPLFATRRAAGGAA